MRAEVDQCANGQRVRAVCTSKSVGQGGWFKAGRKLISPSDVVVDYGLWLLAWAARSCVFVDTFSVACCRNGVSAIWSSRPTDVQQGNDV